jgi:hypothetical protein
MSTKEMETTIEVEVMEAIKVEEAEDDEILVEDEVEDATTSSIVGRMTTSV